MIAYHVDIYEVEDGEPMLVLTHTTYGEDEAEAKDLMMTHASVDPFLHAALAKQRFQGIVLQTEQSVEDLPDEETAEM